MFIYFSYQLSSILFSINILALLLLLVPHILSGIRLLLFAGLFLLLLHFFNVPRDC